jgi:hypothetical protein
MRTLLATALLACTLLATSCQTAKPAQPKMSAPNTTKLNEGEYLKAKHR